MTEPVTVTMSRHDHDRIIAALTAAATLSPDVFQPTLVRAYQWVGETAPPDYAPNDEVQICTDDGTWIPAVVLGVGSDWVRVAYQASSPNGPYTASLTREAIRRPAHRPGRKQHAHG